MSFTCSWVLVQGSLDGVFGLEPGSDPDQAAIFTPLSAEGGPCEFTLEVQDEEAAMSFDIVCNVKLCELYTRRISHADARPSYAGSIAASPTSDGRRLLSVQLPVAPHNGPTQLILRMMHPVPDSKQFTLYSWLPGLASEVSASEVSASASAGSTRTPQDSDVEKVDGAQSAPGISQADAVRQMLEALQPGTGSNGRGASASFGGGLASLVAAAHLPLRCSTPASAVSHPDPPLALTSAQLQLQSSGDCQADSDNKIKEQQMRQQQQQQQQEDPSKRIIADEKQQPNPMQALMGSIGKAMLLKERKQQIAAQQAREDRSVPGDVNRQPSSKSNTSSGSADPAAIPCAAELRGLMQQMLANQKAAAEQQQETTAALQSLTAAVFRLQAKQDDLAAGLENCLGMQTILNDALLAAAASVPES